MNFILFANSQKSLNHQQIQQDKEYLIGNLEFSLDNRHYLNMPFFGLQYLLLRYFKPITSEDISSAESILKENVGEFDRAKWDYILETHAGNLPLRIKAIPEGSIVTNNIVVTVENTDPKCSWLVTYVEQVLKSLWYSCAIAMVGREVKMVLLNALEKTGSPDTIDSRLHDFGYAGSGEQTALSGCAHLINFKSSSNLLGLNLAKDYYQCGDCLGYSVPFIDNNSISSWDSESKCYVNGVNNYLKDNVIIQCSNANSSMNLWGNTLRNLVNMKQEGKLFLLCDGDANTLLDYMNAMHKYYKNNKNNKNYWEITPKFRILFEGISDLVAFEELGRIMERGKWSYENVYFTTTKLYDITKKNTFSFNYRIGGRSKLVFENEKYNTVPESFAGEDVRQIVYENGNILNKTTMEEIRERAFVD